MLDDSGQPKGQVLLTSEKILQWFQKYDLRINKRIKNEGKKNVYIIFFIVEKKVIQILKLEKETLISPNLNITMYL